MEEKPKFSLVEIVLIMLIVIPIDILELITDAIVAIPIIGQIGFVVMRFVDIATSFLFQFWFIMKGVKGIQVLIGNLLGVIPFLRTGTMMAVIYSANHPKIAQIAGTAAGKPNLANPVK